MSFAKNIGTHLHNKYSQKLLDSAKRSTADATKTASKRVIQKNTEGTRDLIGNKIADKITNISKSPQNASRELHSKTDENKIEIPNERYISPEKENKLLMN